MAASLSPQGAASPRTSQGAALRLETNDRSFAGLSGAPSLTHPSILPMPHCSAHKLVLKGQAQQWGAEYYLYLWLKIEADATRRCTFPLLSKEGTQLIDWYIDPLNDQGGYAPLQESAARAAGYLGVPIGVDGHTCESSSSETSTSWARICETGTSISLDVDTSALHSDANTSMQVLVTLELQSPMQKSPPRDPYLVRLTWKSRVRDVRLCSHS